MFSNISHKLCLIAAKSGGRVQAACSSCSLLCRYVPQQQQQQQQQQVRRYLSHNHRPWADSLCLKRLCLVLLPIGSISCAAESAGSTSAFTKFSTSTSSALAASSSGIADAKDANMASEDFKNANSIYDFTVKDTFGNDVPLEKYKGNVVLVVNIASKCGLTQNNYKKLTELKEKFHEKGLRILNFPCNQFSSQMPESDGEPMVCHLRDAKADIGDVFQKIDVNGADTAPLYQYLKAKQTGTLGSSIKWNFTKFLVNKDGIPVDRYAPTTDPMSIAKDIEKLL